MKESWWITALLWLFFAVTGTMIIAGPALALYFNNGDWFWLSLPLIFYLS